MLVWILFKQLTDDARLITGGVNALVTVVAECWLPGWRWRFVFWDCHACTLVSTLFHQAFMYVWLLWTNATSYSSWALIADWCLLEICSYGTAVLVLWCQPYFTSWCPVLLLWTSTTSCGIWMLEFLVFGVRWFISDFGIRISDVVFFFFTWWFWIFIIWYFENWFQMLSLDGHAWDFGVTSSFFLLLQSFCLLVVGTIDYICWLHYSLTRFTLKKLIYGVMPHQVQSRTAVQLVLGQGCSNDNTASWYQGVSIIIVVWLYSSHKFIHKYYWMSHGRFFCSAHVDALGNPASLLCMYLSNWVVVSLFVWDAGGSFRWRNLLPTALAVSTSFHLYRYYSMFRALLLRVIVLLLHPRPPRLGPAMRSPMTEFPKWSPNIQTSHVIYLVADKNNL